MPSGMFTHPLTDDTVLLVKYYALLPSSLSPPLPYLTFNVCYTSQMARNTTEDVFSTQQMRLLSKAALAHLLSNYVTNTSEVQIFRGIVAW